MENQLLAPPPFQCIQDSAARPPQKKNSTHWKYFWWESFIFRIIRATVCNLFCDHPTIILESVPRNVWLYRFSLLDNVILGAILGVVLKILNLKIFEIQPVLEKNKCIRLKNELYFRGIRVDTLFNKKRIRAIALTVLSVDSHTCVYSLTHI